MAKTYIIDGNSLLFRSFYATYRPDQPVMSAKDGTPTNALYTFYPMMTSIHNSLQPGDRMIVCFDTGKPSFRSQEIEGYKAQRKPITPELKTQIPLAHEMLKAMGISTAEREGYEGDDVAGSLAKYARKQGDQVALFTSDKDFLQLIEPGIEVHALRKGLSDIEVYTVDNIKELYGVRADQVADYKAIAGDASDNYKGIPRVGDKTAKSLLEKHDHLEDILAAYKDKSDTALARNLNAGAEEGRLCLKIATIVTDLDVKDLYDQGTVAQGDPHQLLSFLTRYSMTKYANAVRAKMEAKTPKAPEVQEASSVRYAVIHDLDPADLPRAVSVILDGENENVSSVLGFALGHADGRVDFLDAAEVEQATNFREFIEDASAEKDSLDSKSTIVAGRRLGLKPQGFTFDMLLASYLIDSDHAAILEDCFAQLSITLPKDSIQRIVDATAIMERQRDSLLGTIKMQESLPLLTQVEIPLAVNLADMECEGLPIDLGELSRIREEYRHLLKETEATIYELAGQEFNIKSPAQVADILFGKLGIQLDKRESGTSIEVLNNHIADHPIVPMIIQHRTYSKIISAYLDALPKHVLSDGKIHAKLNQTLTSTGRLSCSEPNLQNISIRKEEGKEIRKAFFYPDSDFEFLSLDYSQVELRILASLGHIPNLLKVCNSGEDIHAATASLVFNVPIEKVTHEMRRQAKTVNFGIVYGISTYGLKERLGISFGEAQAIIKAFKQTFDGIEAYEESVKEFAHRNSYVETIMHRRRYFPEIDSTDPRRRAFSERAAVNATIQGSAADLIKVAMNKVGEILKGHRSRMVIQIHDELVFKMAKDEEETLVPKIIAAMENALPLDVKLTVEGSTGHSWFDCK